MRLLFNLIRRLAGLVLLPVLLLSARLRRRLERGAPRWLLLQLEGNITDLPARRSRSILGFWRRERPLVLLEVDAVLREAATDPSISGVVCRLRDLGGGWATFWELREALNRFRAAGKKVVFYFDQASNRPYWLASCADEVLIAPQGHIALLGLRAEVTFFRRLFDQLGVTPDFLRVGQYKSFAEAFTEHEMTPAMQESMTALIDDLAGVLQEGIAQGRRLEPARVKELIDQGPFTAREAISAGLADAALYPDELKERFTVEGKAPRMLSFGGYARAIARRRYLAAPVRPRKRLAIVSMEGNIVDERGGGLPAMRSGITAKWYGRVLHALQEDPRIAAVVLRVNSPGGSALASDMLWRAVARLQEKKPVVVSMGDVAASGGYYLAAPAGRILATPCTLTGSIGVVAGKFSLGALYERLGIRKMAIERGRHSGMHADSRPFSESERARLQQEIDSFYETFVEKVQAGRRLEPDRAAAAAQGRVWSGGRGHALGLVDGFGGIREAVDELKAQQPAGVLLETVTVAPAAAPMWGRMFARLPLPGAVRELILTVASWSALAGDGTQVLAVMPYSVVIE